MGKSRLSDYDFSPAMEKRIKTLIRKLHATADETRLAAATEIARIGFPAVPLFIDALSAPSSMPRTNAAAFVRTADQTLPLPALCELLHGPDAQIRSLTDWVQGTLGPSDTAAAAQALLRLLHDPQDDVRLEFAESLEGLFRMRLFIQGGPEVVEVLLPDLTDPDPNVRFSAAYGLGLNAPRDRAVADALIAAGQHEEDDETLYEICEAVVRITQSLKANHNAALKKVRPFLEQVRDTHSSTIVRIQANMGLQDLHTDDNAAVPLLADAPSSDWPALSHGELSKNFKALQITYLAHRICQRHPEQSFSCRAIAAELESHGFQESDETIRKCLIAVRDLFRDHFKNPHFLLYDTSRRGIQFWPAHASREHTTVWKFLYHLADQLPAKPAVTATFIGKIDKR